MHVAALSIYPVKSFRGIALALSRVEARGLVGDRDHMLVDEAGTFISQREDPRLATLSVEVAEDGLVVRAEGLDPITVRRAGDGRRAVTVWGDPVDAAHLDECADAALSRWLERPVQLVTMDATSERTASADWAPGAPVTFADGFPVLVATTASLEALNARIVERGGAAVPMARFRPNIVVEGGEAWAEDGWATIRIGEVAFDLVKPCSRCIMTTTDQLTGARESEEPLRTLATFRRSLDRRSRGVIFGWNAVPRGAGVVRCGDPVEVEATRPAWPMG